MYFHNIFTCHVCIIWSNQCFKLLFHVRALIGIDVIIVIIHSFLNQLITFQVFFKDTHNWRYLAMGLNLYVHVCTLLLFFHVTIYLPLKRLTFYDHKFVQ